MNRRGFLKAMIAAAAAPAIVRAESLMPLWVPSQEIVVPKYGFDVDQWYQISVAHLPGGAVFFVNGERVSPDHPLAKSFPRMPDKKMTTISAWVKHNNTSSVEGYA